mmetsp:Transcript_35407/g.57740  ORF Transcript_35407/g.57740 Transcript_35407/m.57740 type:complete len:271 (+) Transcript_35407:388-1200(+)
MEVGNNPIYVGIWLLDGMTRAAEWGVVSAEPPPQEVMPAIMTMPAITTTITKISTWMTNGDGGSTTRQSTPSPHSIPWINVPPAASTSQVTSSRGRGVKIKWMKVQRRSFPPLEKYPTEYPRPVRVYRFMGFGITRPRRPRFVLWRGWRWKLLSIWGMSLLLPPESYSSRSNAEKAALSPFTITAAASWTPPRENSIPTLLIKRTGWRNPSGGIDAISPARRSVDQVSPGLAWRGRIYPLRVGRVCPLRAAPVWAGRRLWADRLPSALPP